jgi:hypothetical protein
MRSSVSSTAVSSSPMRTSPLGGGTSAELCADTRAGCRRCALRVPDGPLHCATDPGPSHARSPAPDPAQGVDVARVGEVVPVKAGPRLRLGAAQLDRVTTVGSHQRDQERVTLIGTGQRRHGERNVYEQDLQVGGAQRRVARSRPSISPWLFAAGGIGRAERRRCDGREGSCRGRRSAPPWCRPSPRGSLEARPRGRHGQASSGSRPPASSRSTRAPSSFDSRAAITRPAVPAPTTMKSCSSAAALEFTVRSAGLLCVMSLLRLRRSTVAAAGDYRIRHA